MLTKVEYMERALALASEGGKAVRPNPLVGAVLVKDGNIVGEGYHKQYGSAHAETEAIRDAGDAARGATMYVTLEPCNHQGQTPPCTNGILEAGISEVVIGMRDPNPDVAGSGSQMLKENGVPCELGVLEDACRIQNEVYLANVLKKKPFVLLKIAQSMDGFIAPQDGNSKWITGEESRTESHRLRALTDAIMVGAGTLIADDPELTVRHVAGDQPWRILMTDTLNFSTEAKLFTDIHQSKTMVFATENASNTRSVLGTLKRRGIETVFVKENNMGRADINDVLLKLWNRGVYSLMVEGGAALYSSFLQSGNVNRIDLFTAGKVFGTGISTFRNIPVQSVDSAQHFNVSSVRILGNDIHAIMRKN
jgi:diaminohydroxyphosphoribosylaminopyrimidine deaminase / 5-amino-6-(5-phosphoribosylamino)uracil reductase